MAALSAFPSLVRSLKFVRNFGGFHSVISKDHEENRTMQTRDEDLTMRYRAALDTLVEKLRQDRYILAAILFGSLSYDRVWRKSDIDLLLIGRDEKKPAKGFSLAEDGINIHASLFPRSKFKEAIEGSLQGSFMHSTFSRSTLLFSHDETIAEYYENVFKVGAHDQQMMAMRAACGALYYLAKTEKWFYVKKDYPYTFMWLTWTVNSLADVETLLHGEIPGREVLQQAIKINPDFFNAVYTDLTDLPKTRARLQKAIDRVNGYLDERACLLFQPVLDYLADEGGVRTTTELSAYFKKVAQSGLDMGFEWLAEKGIIRQVETPIRLHEKSAVTVNEAAYYYDGGEQ